MLAPIPQSIEVTAHLLAALGSTHEVSLEG